MTGWDTATGRLGPGAEWYARQGWKVFPCFGIVQPAACGCGLKHAQPKDWGKHPQGHLVPNGQKEATCDAAQVRDWWTRDPEANVAVMCRESGFLVVDVDPRSGGLDSWDKLEEMTEGALPRTVQAITGEYSTPGGVHRGRHLFYRVAPGERLRGGITGLPGVDVKHNGYVLIHPSRHASGLIYEWEEGAAPWERAMEVAPEELLALLRKTSGAAAAGGSGYGAVELGGQKIDVDALIEDGIHEGERSNTLYRIACALGNEYPLDKEYGRASLRRVMIEINQQACKPPMTWGDGGPDDLAPQVESAIAFIRENPKEKMLAGLLSPELMPWLESARDAGRAAVTGPGAADPLRPAESPERAERTSYVPAALAPMSTMPVNPADELPPDMDEWGNDANERAEDGTVVRRTLTDRGNARRLRDWYRGTVRYTPGMGWFIWDQGRQFWRPDEEGLGVLEKSQAIAALVAKELIGADPASDESKRTAMWALASKNTGRMKSAIEQWKADSEFTKTSASTWDANPYYLGVQNGVIDLRSGDLLEGKLEMGITKQAAVTYTKGMRNTRWAQFLEFATGGDKEFQEWLQRAAGYTLTGLRDHDVFFMVYGQPGSGKSTFLEAIGHVLGTDYFTTMNSNILIDDGMKSSSDEYHWAQLRGRRMVVFSEWPEGHKTKEDAIKRLTGDLTIQARHPGERPFTFESQAKLWLGTNAKPAIQEDAMWRRIRAIPFACVPENPDPALKPYLMDPEGGLPAVVAWAVEGAVRLINSPARDALGWCSVVADASAYYKQQEDRIGLFLDEETQPGEGASTPMVTLYGVYRGWVEDRGEKPLTTIGFVKQLERRGLTIKGRGKRGLLLERSLIPRVVEPIPDWATMMRRGSS